METKKKVLIASPVHQKPAILEQFLKSLENLRCVQFHVDYMFIDDNKEDASYQLLIAFQKRHMNTLVSRNDDSQIYICDDQTHHWTGDLISKVAAMKDSMIQRAIHLDYDFIFFVDSDLILQSGTLEQLVAADKDIISNIFWTKWQPDYIELPQVWLQDEYAMFRKQHVKSNEEAWQESQNFINQLRIPGIYEVGGLGACTLINRRALQAGVSFKGLHNISFWGEDRHFCIRAVALGFSLFVDTHFPAYHIYRESDLQGVEAFIRNNVQG